MSGTPIGWYKWYPRDFLASSTVRRMSITGRGVYRELLDLQWEDGKVPSSYLEAISIIGCSDVEAKSFEPYFEACFPDGINPKLDEQRQKSVSAIEAQRDAGLKSAEAKKQGKSKVSPSKPQGKSNPTETETETETRVSKDTHWLESVKKEYPKRDGDICWSKAKSKIESIPIKERELCLSGVIAYRNHLESKGKLGTEFVKQAPTFFNQESWKEDWSVKASPNGRKELYHE